MASNFPSSLDAFTNPTSADAMDSVSVPHATQHSDLNDAVEALEAKVGADGSAVVSSHDYKIAQLEAGATGGKILQVVSVAKTDAFTTTSTSYTDLTGLSVSITPSSATSKILVGYSVIAQGLNTTNMGGIQLVRNSTPILVADSAGSRSVSSSIVSERSATHTAHQSNVFVDSPATTSATTYKLQIRTYAGTIWVNRTNNDTDVSAYYRGTSTLYAMEVAA